MFETYHGLALDRFQREAMEGIARGDNVIVAAPTGAGKTLIAHFAIERALESGKRVIYTAPIKALSNQKYRDLQAHYPGRVGIATGDVSIDPDADAVIMTTEIFRNTIFEDPARLEEIAWVIFDEVHYMDDPDRGTVWEESLIFAPPGIRVLALSATVSNLDEFAAWIREARGSEVRVVLEERRPVPLTIHVASTDGGVVPIDDARKLRAARSSRRGQQRRSRDIAAYYARAWRRLVDVIADRDELPLLFFLFSRDGCEKLATACMERDFSASPAARAAATAEYRRLVDAFELDASDAEVRRLESLIGRGIAYHHAGILPALKEVIERLFSSGHVRLLCATETFALGINMPARSVAFEGIRKFNGVARVPLKTREFQQMAGRAGRRGLDEAGAIYLTFDPNRDDPAVIRDMVFGRVEPVTSQFNLSYGTLLNLYTHLGERIYEACERSFANFKSRRQGGGGGGGGGRGKGRERRRPGRDFHHDHPLRPASPYERALEEAGHVVRGRERRRGDGRGRGRGGRQEGGRRRRGAPPQATPPQYPPYRPHRFADIVEQVRIKLGILRELQYLDSQGRVTDRGRFAMLVFGHEMEMTELVWSGVLDGLSSAQVAVVATAVVFESRKGVYYGGEDPRRILTKHVFRRCDQAVRDLARLETERGVRQPVLPLDWELSGVTWEWVHGAEFNDLRELTDASDGDLVRTLRQTIQLLRLCYRPLKSLRRADLARRVRDAQQLLKRDLVDAEWQLRRGAELEAEYQATSGPEAASPSDPSLEPVELEERREGE